MAQQTLSVFLSPHFSEESWHDDVTGITFYKTRNLVTHTLTCCSDWELSGISNAVRMNILQPANVYTRDFFRDYTLPTPPTPPTEPEEVKEDVKVAVGEIEIKKSAEEKKEEPVKEEKKAPARKAAPKKKTAAKAKPKAEEVKTEDKE